MTETTTNPNLYLTFHTGHPVGSQLWCDAVSAHARDLVERDSIEELSEKEPGRNHLGASELGRPCSREIWYNFRWYTIKKHSGAVLRLFNRGHSEEPKFIHRLRRIGIEVLDFDPATGKQWRVVHPRNAHVGGSLDSIFRVTWLPEGHQWMLGEFKTHNTGSFAKLLKDKVRKSKPQHWSQMQIYGRAYGLQYSFYCAINKNDDDLEFQVNPLAPNEGDMLAEKAIGIAESLVPPKKLSHNSSQQECKFCDHRMVCHFKGEPYKSCRSCLNVIPLPDGTWTCKLFGGPIPREVELVGCGSYQANV